MKDLEIGHRIRNIRTSYGLTQAEFAAEIGRSAGYVSLLEKGNIYSDDVLTTICSRFSVDESWLRTGVPIEDEVVAPGVGERIKTIRTKMGFSQREFAKIFSLSNPQITRMEKGDRNPPKKLLYEIAERLSISTAYLIDGADFPSRWIPPTEFLDDEMVEIIQHLLTHQNTKSKVSEEIHSEAPSTLGTRIKEKRIEKGLTQQELGEMLGHTRQPIVNYERGVSVPSPDVLEKIATALGVSISVLTGGEPS